MNCGIQYVGQTGRPLKVRFREHSYKVRNSKKFKNFLYNHFRTTGHTVNDVSLQPLEYIAFDSTASKSYKIQARHNAELKWIRNLQTPYPLGLNDNIYREGNISKNPDIDVFSIMAITKRKRRSHGRRKNHNVRRKSHFHISIAELHAIYKRSGRHKLLSKITNLSTSSLRKLDEEADNIYVRANPFYDVACIVQSYTQHVLRPHIDATSDHQRHFLKISYVNKGIDFIDLASILKDRRVIDKIPKYFKNSETPMICYKYKRSTRGLLFNYNKIVSDLNIKTSTPTQCDCSTSRFCYGPAGHIITGNLDVIEDNRIRKLISKGPKYRIPAEIDFDACHQEIAESLSNFCSRWCKREKTDKSALSEWKKAIFRIVHLRTKFYSSNSSLLPRKPKLSFKHLKRRLQELHSKFVLVPADKASNNIILV